MMTIKRLEQYRALRREVSHDEARISALCEIRTAQREYGNRIRTSRCADSTADYVEYLDQIQQVLHENRKRCAVELLTILNFIDQIPDSQLREIFKLRFLDGYSWIAVAGKLGTSGDGSTERKCVCRYLKRRAEEGASQKGKRVV